MDVDYKAIVKEKEERLERKVVVEVISSWNR